MPTATLDIHSLSINSAIVAGLENVVTGQHSLPLSLSPTPCTSYCVCLRVRENVHASVFMRQCTKLINFKAQ